MRTVTHKSVSNLKISLGKCSPPSRLHEPQKTSWTLPSSMDPGSEAIQHLCKQNWCYTGSVPCHNIPVTGLTSFQGEPVQHCPGMTVHLQGEKLTWIDLRPVSSIRGWPRFCHGSFVLRCSDLPAVLPWEEILCFESRRANVKYL